MINILVVEDNAILRKGICMRLALEPDLHIIGDTGDGQEALCIAEAAQPDVIIMDLKLPGMDGVAVTSRLRELASPSKVVILTLYDEISNRQRASEAGAAAFVSKQEPNETLLRAIRSAANPDKDDP